MEQTELINWLKDAAESAGEFVQREAPLVANEIVAWHFWSSVGGIAFCSLAASLAWGVAGWFFLRWKAFGYELRDGQKGEGCGILFFALTLTGFAIFLPGLGFNGYEAIKAKVAPRVVIIEYIRGASK